MENIQTVQKWGNSMGIRLPKKLLLAAHLKPNQQVKLDIGADGGIVLTPLVGAPKITLKSLLKNVNPKDVGGELNWGDDAGLERHG